MNRRTVLAGAGITLSLLFSGCFDSEGDEAPESQDQSDDSVGDEETNENRDSSEEIDDETPKDDEAEPGPGGPMIQVSMFVTDDHPDDVTPLSSDDERIADVQLFCDLFKEVEEAAHQKGDDGIIGETFTDAADREDSEEGREALSAMEKLPLREENLEEWNTEEGVYVNHSGHIIFMFFRLYHLD